MAPADLSNWKTTCQGSTKLIIPPKKNQGQEMTKVREACDRCNDTFGKQQENEAPRNECSPNPSLNAGDSLYVKNEGDLDGIVVLDVFELEILALESARKHGLIVNALGVSGIIVKCKSGSTFLSKNVQSI